MSYLLQAGRGQLAISNRSRPLQDVLADERIPPRIRRLLAEVPSVKAFGETHSLKSTSNYEEYVDLKRSAAVWVVSACEPLRFRSKQWSFPVVGSFSYLGWFDRKDADDHAAELRKENENWDVSVRGASAYSTLGWFRDPILSTMIGQRESAWGQLVNVILHESVHATKYVSGQSRFNESLASFVANQLTDLYLKEKHSEESTRLQAYRDYRTRARSYRKKMNSAYLKLDELYRSSVSVEQKSMRKNQILKELAKGLKIKRPLNNAHLVQFKTYYQDQKGFELLFKKCNRNWTSFFRAVHGIDSDDFKEPQAKEFSGVLEKVGVQYCTNAAKLTG